MRRFPLTLSDLKYILRLLVKKPGFTFLSILVLAGGLGVSILFTTFSYTLMFKTLPVENGDRIYHVCYAHSGLGCRSFKAFEFARLREDITTLENVGIYREDIINFEVGEEFVQTSAVFTEWNMFSLTGAQALLGRTLQAYDHEAEAEPVIVLSYDFWQQQFRGEEAALNTVITIQGRSTRIVGVMPEGYLFPRYAEIWLPISSELLSPLQATNVRVNTYALLKEGATQEAASAEIASLMQRVRQLYPPDPDQDYLSEFFRRLDNADTGHVKNFPMASLGGLETVILIGFLNFIAFCIFLLAAINVSTLLLARTNERIKDISIRVALGAPRRRLLMQAMGEGIAISLCGGLVAVMFAGAGLELINLAASYLRTASGGGIFAFWQIFRIDNVTLVSVGIFLSLTIFFTSAIPCLRIINGDFNAVMRDGTRGALGLRAGRFSRSLVLIAITLIVFMFYISAIAISQIMPFRDIIEGFEVENRFNTNFTLPQERYGPEQKVQFYRTLVSSLSQDPAISAVSVDSSLTLDTTIERLDDGDAGSEIFVRTPVSAIFDSRSMSPNNLSDIQLLEGRHLDARDGINSPKTILISQSLAERLWPGQSPIDQSIRLIDELQGFGDEVRQVVGVISEGVNSANPFSDTAPMAMLPINQVDAQRISVEVIANEQNDAASSGAAAVALARAIRTIDPAITFSVENFEQAMGLLTRLINMAIYFGIGSLLFALAIALTGIYGLTQNAVQLMTQEIGTRRALGATDGRIRNLMLRRGSKQVVYGFLLAMVLTSPITLGVLFFIGNSTLAPVFLQVFAAMGILAAVVYLALYFPVRRVLVMEPSEALRHE